MDGFFGETLNQWSWWIFAAAFFILEIMAPGAVFMWLGVAAGIMGFIYLLVPGLSLSVQLVIFAVLSVASVLAGRAYLKKNPTHTDDTVLNRRGEQYIGRVFSLTEPIVNGSGKLNVDDGQWKIRGADMPAGTQVKVTGVDGVILLMEKEGQSASSEGAEETVSEEKPGE